MTPFQAARWAVFGAVLLQAIGKIVFGGYLVDFPAPAFVFLSFSLATCIFWLGAKHTVGKILPKPLIALNIGTATTFISIFVALKSIEPAIVGAIEIGIGPIFAALMGAILIAERITIRRLVVCGGILFGCSLLGVAAFQQAGLNATSKGIPLALGLSVFAGLGAVVISISSKHLLASGWSQASILTHRSYIIIPAALGLWFAGGYEPIDWDLELATLIIAVSALSIILPLYLLLLGLKKCDVYTVMVTMATQPVITFTLEIFSSHYHPTILTATGIAIVTLFVLIDHGPNFKKYTVPFRT